MLTLRSFLNKKIIFPLEAITSANRRLQNNDSDARWVNLPNSTPKEIREIVETRSEMLGTIIKVSEERLRLSEFVRETFGRYLSKDVVEEILSSPEGQKIGGRRETVTILMSDLRGFTYLSETRDPEEMVQLLNRYLERMSKVIVEYEGTIDEFVGDAILVVFGVPTKRADDPARAVACAVAMQKALVELNDEIVSEGYPSLEMGIGINTGTVIAGNIGSEMRAKYGIVGSAVNIASRIESTTVGGQVLLSESTYRLVSGMVTTDPPQTFMMKGLRKVLVSYPVSAIGEPYNLVLPLEEDHQDGIQLSLPFHCWRVEEKKITSDSMYGETKLLNENMMIAVVKPPLEELTNIKLIFDFCVDAHCFEEIYAKVVHVEDYKGESANHIRITSILPEDREMLRKWTAEAS
jgi:class 3 adenylate cyclase